MRGMTRRHFLLWLPLVCGLFSSVVSAESRSKRKAVRSAAKQPPKKPIDVNQASAEELEKLPGVGPVTAKAIVSYREKNGPFRRLEELMIIQGISEERLEKLRPWLTVGK